MGIPLRAGRLFDEHDDAQPDGVLAIDQTMARRFWPGESPLGKRIKLGPAPEKQPWITIIGVVGDTHHFGLDADPRPEIYRPPPAARWALPSWRFVPPAIRRRWPKRWPRACAP